MINRTYVTIPTELYKFFSLKANNPVEPELIRFISSNLKKGDVFIDVGANIGLVSLIASKLVDKDGLVIAFEPNPWVFKQFVRIQNLNSAENVKSLELAISNKGGIGVLNMNDLDSMLMTRSSMQIKDSGAFSVKVLTNRLDDLGLPDTIKILKIDVEGAELFVLEGAHEVIKSRRPMVCMEIHGLFFDEPKKHVMQVFNYFEELDYKCYNIHKESSENVTSFTSDTGMVGRDDISGKLFSETGYGQVVFYPSESELIEN